MQEWGSLKPLEQCTGGMRAGLWDRKRGAEVGCGKI